MKLSNLLRRGAKVTEEDAAELRVDMRSELKEIKGLESVRVVCEGGLGAEKGCVFAEFQTQEACQQAKEKMQGRVYDGRKIQARQLDEGLYRNFLANIN